MTTSLLMFLAFIAITLGITYWASNRTKTTAEFYSAGRSRSPGSRTAGRSPATTCRRPRFSASPG